MYSIERYPLLNHNLTNWVKFIWHFKAENADVHHKLLPMDSIDIVLNLADEMVYETKTNRVVAPTFHINGLRSSHSFIYQKGNIDVWGISFYAFGLYPFINTSIKEFQDKIVDLNAVSKSLENKLNIAVSPHATQPTFEGIVKALNSELQIDEDFLKKVEIINAFMNTDNMPIDAFCRNHDINQKTFERYVMIMTGYSPINLRRVRRYKAASNQLLFDASAKIPEIVYDHHYADQSHFTKVCRKFSGVPPRICRLEKNTVLENTTFI